MATAKSIGADEVGSGDTFCGLVVSAACVTREQEDALRAHRVRDSKRISDSMIGQYVALMTEIGVRHSTVVLNPQQFNKLLAEGLDHVQVQNAMYERAITSLVQKVGHPEKVYVDQYPGARINIDHDTLELLPGAGDKYLSVAAASIMARSAYLGMRRSLEKELGMQIPLGSSNVEEALRHLINREVDISKYAKLYPNNVRELLRESH